MTGDLYRSTFISVCELRLLRLSVVTENDLLNLVSSEVLFVDLISCAEL